MKRLLFASMSILALGIATWQLQGQSPAQTEPERLKPFMQHKLVHSKAILEGLVLEDYEKIAKSAQALSLLSLESNWNVLNTEEYLHQSSDFRRAIKVIIEAAHENNVDRATLGYVNLTVRCVECHKYMRKKQAAVPAKDF